MIKKILAGATALLMSVTAVGCRQQKNVESAVEKESQTGDVVNTDTTKVESVTDQSTTKDEDSETTKTETKPETETKSQETEPPFTGITYDENDVEDLDEVEPESAVESTTEEATDVTSEPEFDSEGNQLL